MSILNPELDPQIELVEFGVETYIKESELPCLPSVKSYKCPVGFAADQDLLLKYSQLAFGEYCSVVYAGLTIDGVSLNVVYKNQQYSITVRAWNFELFNHILSRAYTKSIASELVPVAPSPKPTGHLFYF